MKGILFGRRYNYKPLSIAAVSRQRDETWNIFLKAMYLVLQSIDLGLTVLAAQMGYLELNPFMRAALTSTSTLLIMKLFIPLLVCWLLPGKYLIPAIALLAVIVGWNIKELVLLAF